VPQQPRRPPSNPRRRQVEHTGADGTGNARKAHKPARKLDTSRKFAREEARHIAVAEEAAVIARTRRLSILRDFLRDLRRWRRTHKDDGRREAMIFVDRANVTPVIDALAWALEAEFERTLLNEIVGKALHIAEKRGAGAGTRYLRLAGDGDGEAGRGTRGPSYTLGQVGMDYIKMTKVKGVVEFPYMNPRDRAAGRPALRITCPIKPNPAIWRLTKLYGMQSPTATLRLLQRIRTIGRKAGEKSDQACVRDAARLLMDDLPYKWGE
jgi:hypothetical protein